ncbi:MAG: molecular chaperone HtpG [Bacteroidota bacterium]|nr:molecular chaperone HtpG [Bacteroidota bacterium]
MRKGKIKVTSDNIFPVIKKFLYSDHEIFLREIVSNAVDATQKLNTLIQRGEVEQEVNQKPIEVLVDKDEKTITVRDFGIGMTEDEVLKYLNQIALSSAEEFLEKYKDDANAIIGHFGLGFFSSFMVSKKVEVLTRSYQKDAQPVVWECEGDPKFKLKEAEREHVGTDVIMYIEDENSEFLNESKIQELLDKYCKFLPIPITFGKKKEWKEDKEIETDEANIINNSNPVWKQQPADLKDDDYKAFYRELYPAMMDEPMFHIHLNVDYPFNLTGILYFPKIRQNIDMQKNKIQLYSNQVFVTDSVEGIVPEFLTMLHGVIDSPDIPLNISRSYLQSDSNVKKISGYITKKVADKLIEFFKNDRKLYEEKWDDLKVFVEYGMMTEEKFYDKMLDYLLLRNVDGKYFTIEEYKEIVKENQTNKDKQLIYLYSSDRDAQFTHIKNAQDKGYDVLLMDGQLDTHFLNHMESKLENSRFVRVDGDVAEKLIEKDEKAESKLELKAQENVKQVFETQLPKGSSYSVRTEELSENSMPVMITQDEFMRRMKDMSHLSGGMYGNLPDSYALILNTNHPLIGKLSTDIDSKIGDDISTIDEEITAVNQKINEQEAANKEKKDEEIPQEEKDNLEGLKKSLSEKNSIKTEKFSSFGQDTKLIKQLIDLALLSNNMLKGESLDQFVKRSLDMIGK